MTRSHFCRFFATLTISTILVAVVVANFLADMVLLYIDPRIKT